MSEKTVCPVPWMHLAFEPSGKVIPCCLTSPHASANLGNLNKQSIESIWNSDRLKEIRLQMLNGEKPNICRKCYDREDVTGESARTYHRWEFSEVLDKIPAITLDDGTATEMELKYWDFRFSNLCNFKCRSCGPTYSTSWVPDAKKLGWTVQDKVWNIEAVDESDNFKFLEEQMKHVKKIYFAGGEPLMMPEHWQIMDSLVENKRFDVRISYNTNASLLKYNKKNILDYWRQWEDLKIEVWPSLDEIGERAELIRSGTEWHKVEQNIIAMSELDNIIVRPGMTIGAWNVRRLPTIITHLLDIGVIKSKKRFGYHYNNFFINLLEQPSFYHVSILPDWYREETIKELETFIDSHKQKYDSDLSEIFKHIMHELRKPWQPGDAAEFLKISQQVDGVRNENVLETIPEMNCVKDAVEEHYGNKIQAVNV